MSWITEDPLPLFILALMVQAFLGFALWQTGRGWILYSMLGLLGVNIALLAAEYAVVTDREAIVNTLSAICVDLENNNVDGVLTHVAPSASELRNEGTRIMKRIEVTEARLASDVIVKIAEPASPGGTRTASANFLLRLRAHDTKNANPYEQLALRLTVHFTQDADGRWLVTGYEKNRLL